MVGLGARGTAPQWLLARREPRQATGGLLTLPHPSGAVRCHPPLQLDGSGSYVAVAMERHESSGWQSSWQSAGDDLVAYRAVLGIRGRRPGQNHPAQRHRTTAVARRPGVHPAGTGAGPPGAVRRSPGPPDRTERRSLAKGPLVAVGPQLSSTCCSLVQSGPPPVKPLTWTLTFWPLRSSVTNRRPRTDCDGLASRHGPRPALV